MGGLGSPADADPASWLRAVADEDPGRPLIRVPGGRSYDYGEVADISGRYAACFAGHGVTVGERVAVQVDKSPESFMLYLACLRMGAIFVPLNTGYSAAEMEYFVRDCEPHMLICRPEATAQLVPVAEQCSVPILRTLGRSGEGTFSGNAVKYGSGDFLPFRGDLSETAALLYTSGTTGRSKGAMITRGALAHCADVLREAWQFTPSDILLHALPVFHGHGLFIAANTVLAAGAQMIFMERFSAEEVVYCLPEATVFMGVPTMYTRLLQHPGLSRAACSRLRLAVSGSAPVRAETLQAFRERTGSILIERYGLTETLIVTSDPVDSPKVPGSVGRPVRDVEVRIADVQTGSELSDPDAIGRIEVRGPGLFRGYWRNPEKTAADMRRDGFFSTGDLGRLDEAGFLHLAGRDDDTIITGGYNVYPKEVEAELDALGFTESAVVGLPHPDFGEAVTAIVVSGPGSLVQEADLLEMLQKNLAGYKCPKKVLFVTELPRNVMGKVQKNRLKQQHELLYQRGSGPGSTTSLPPPGI